MTSKLFKRFIASYLLISMLPVLFGYLTYQQAISRARDKTYSLFQTMVEKTASEIAGVFAEVQSCANRLSVDPSVLALLRARPTQDDPGTTFRMFDARQALARNKIFNNSLIDIALYCESPDVVVTTTHVFISIDRYYDLFFKYRDFSLPRFLALLPEGRMGDRYLPAAPIMVRTGADTVSQSESILFVRNIRTPPHHAKLIAQISMDALSAPIGSLLQEYEGFMVVLDENGNRLATFGDAPEDAAYLQAGGPLTLSGKRMFVTGESTEQNGWRYVAGLSERAVLSDVNMLTFSVLTILLIQVALLFALAFVFTRQNVKPVQSIMALVGDNAPPSYGVDEYDYIQRMVTLLKETTGAFKTGCTTSSPFLGSGFSPTPWAGPNPPCPAKARRSWAFPPRPGRRCWRCFG